MSELTDIPQWAFDRVDQITGYQTPRTAFARYIAKHEQPPVDPVILEAREIAAARHPSFASDCRAGNFDGWLSDVIAGLRRGIEIGRAG